MDPEAVNIDVERTALTGVLPQSSMNAVERTPQRVHEPVLSRGCLAYVKRSTKALAIGRPGERPWLNLLIGLVPFAFLSNHLAWGNAVTFVLALLAICPFAERLNFVTEDLTKYTNATIGGLLNASFGNVTEVIVSIVALRQGELWLIQASMLGSILSNLLLVLGSAFLVGGCRIHKSTKRGESVSQSYNTTASNVNISLLLLCVAVFSLPTILQLGENGSNNVSEDGSAGINLDFYSGCVAAILICVYAAYLVFQLMTHKNLFDDEEDDDMTPPILGLWGALLWLGVATVFISLLSDLLVDSFTNSTNGIGIPSAFVWTVLVPIVGNAAEHASAVMFAYVVWLCEPMLSANACLLSMKILNLGAHFSLTVHV